MTASPPVPNTLRIDSLSAWDQFFHPVTGQFRLPHATGASIEHLDIDLRLVNESPYGTRDVQGEVYLPNVCKLTLRGGEFCQDDDKRVDCLVEVLGAINPVQVRWLHAKGSVENTFSLSTHMVHQGIIRVGQHWSNLRDLTVQGGYPCPNLTAPTPYAVTPAHTPLPSPGARMRTFSGLQAMSSADTDRITSVGNFTLGSIPSIPSYKAIHPDSAKATERAERKRLADYALKPRFEYAFGGWAPEQLRWTMEGRYTPAAITTIMTNLFKAFSSTFPSASVKVDKDLPALLAFSSIPLNIISTLQALPEELQLEPDVVAYLQDACFIALPSSSSSSPLVGEEQTKYARLFDLSSNQQQALEDDRTRMGRRMKAEMLLLSHSTPSAGIEIVSLQALTGVPPPSAAHAGAEQGMLSANGSMAMTSPAHSCASLAMTDGTSLSDGEAVTPDMAGSLVLEPGLRIGTKSRSASLEAEPQVDTPVNGKTAQSAANILGVNGAAALH